MNSLAIKKVLLLGSFDIGALEHQYMRVMRTFGMNVICYDIQKVVHEKRNRTCVHKIGGRVYADLYLNEVNKDVISLANKQKPDMILVFKGMELLPRTIKTLKSHTRLLCNYNPDHPYLFLSRGAGNAHVKNSIKYYDIYFTYSSAITKGLKDQFNVNTYCVPFGYDETINPVRNSFFSDRFIFVGTWDRERERIMNQLGNDLVDVYGSDFWKYKSSSMSKVRQMYKGRSLYENDYADALHSASGSINLLRRQNIIESSHNMRTFETPGYGGVLISQRTEEQLAFFEENKEAIFFDSIDELKDKLIYLKNHSGLIDTIKKNAINRSLSSGYSYYERVTKLLMYIQKFI